MTEVTPFREFVEESKDVCEHLMASVGEDRLLTPMLTFVDPEGQRAAVGIDPQMFRTPESRTNLVERFIVPLAQERGAQRIAFFYEATITTRTADEPPPVVDALMRP